MLNPRYVFDLDGDVPVETEGGTVTAQRIAGSSYTECDYINDEHTPTYLVKGQTGGFTVRQSDVTRIIDLEQVDDTDIKDEA